MRSLIQVFCIIVGIGSIAVVAEENAAQPAKTALSDAAKAELSALLPPPETLGAQRTADPLFYSPETLYEYIDGAAESFIGYDFVNLVNAQYKMGEVELTLDIYNMGAPLNAFGIYSAERSPSYTFTEIGIQGSINEYGLNFLQQKYYVKISAFGPEGQIPEALKKFSKAVSQKIGTVDVFPGELDWLPKAARIRNSEKFMKHNPLGYAFMGPMFAASYTMEGNEFLTALQIADDPQTVEKELAALKQHFEKSQAQAKAIQIAGIQGFEFQSKYEGRVTVLQVERCLLLTLNAPSKSEKFLSMEIERLREQQKKASQPQNKSQ